MGNATESISSDLYQTCLSHGYKLQKKIGEGGFGKVYKAKNIKDRQPYAIKIQESDYMIHQEVQKLKMTSKSPYTVCLFDDFASGELHYLVMEFCEKGSLKTLLDRKGSLGETESLYFFEQICSGVKYLHENRIIHRDLKPDNILLTKRKKRLALKISDFGISKIADTFMTLAGTREYLSPEYFVEITESVKTNRTDIWALGCILFEMITGRGPFVKKNLDNLLDVDENLLREGKIHFGEHKISEEIRDILQLCLNPNYRTRIDIESLLVKVRENLTIKRFMSSNCIWFDSLNLYNSKSQSNCLLS